MKLVGIAVLTVGALLPGACASQSRPNEVTLTAKTMPYDPPIIEVTADVPLELTFVNGYGLEHDFSILEIPMESVSQADPMSTEHEMQMGAGVEPVLDVAAEPGATNHLSFTPTKPGTYEFLCSVAGHKEAGMVGAMVVKAP